MFESARREGRRLESLLEAKLRQLSRVSAGGGLGGLRGGLGDEEAPLLAPEASRLLTDAEDLLTGLQDCAARMGDSVGDAGPAGGAQLQRFRAIVADHAAEFAKAKAGLVRRQERAELLRGASGGGGGGGGGGGSGGNVGENPGMEHLLRERSAVGSSRQAMDEILRQGAATQSEAARQREQMMRAGGRLATMGSEFGGLNGLIERIQNKKVRDNAIVAIFIGLCVCFTLWWMLS